MTLIHLFLTVVLTSITNGAVLPTITEDRIAGGSTASLEQYPFATALYTNYGAGSYLQACGGTILTTTAILSAASCFQTEGTAHPVLWWRARVGTEFTNSGGVTHIVRLITLHPNFFWSEGDSDIAVLRTALPINFVANTVGAASIAGGAYTLSTNQAVTAIGWGVTSNAGATTTELRTVQIWIVDHDSCTLRYDEVNFTLTDNMVCAGWLDVGVRGQCLGDSGSPLLDNGVVVAVHSRTEGCALGRYPGVNTRVAPYTRWIVSTATTDLDE